MKRKVKKKKIKIGRVFLALFFLFIVLFLIILLSKMPVLGFYISGNNYYTDSEILKITGLDKYPSYLFTNNIIIKKKIKDNPILESVKINKTLLGKFKVEVKEKQILFYNINTKKSITSNGEEIDFYDKNSPVLVNNINDKNVYNSFLKKMKKVDKSILDNISEIKYDPNAIDKERFLISMNDGNYIYLTISKFTKINDYLKISKTLGNKNGILYLDYGNYFVPSE